MPISSQKLLKYMNKHTSYLIFILKYCILSENRMRGIVSVVVDDCFAIHGIRIIEGDNGLFVAMPSRKNSDGTYHDVAHPITPECRKMFEDTILEEYKKVKEEKGE